MPAISETENSGVLSPGDLFEKVHLICLVLRFGQTLERTFDLV